MNVADLHRRFAKDETYRRAYEEFGDWIELGLRCRALRELAKVARPALAKELGLGDHAVAKFERGDERRPEVVGPIVARWADDLMAQGFAVQHLLPPAAPKSAAGSYGVRVDKVVQRGVHGAIVTPLQRYRIVSKVPDGVPQK
jgi:hypothetical protein